MNDPIWPEETPIPLDHELVPEPIRDTASNIMAPGDALHRVETEQNVEWWLFNQHGNLVESFWLE